MPRRKPVTKAVLTNEELSATIKLKNLEAQELDLNIKHWEERRFKNEEKYIAMSQVNLMRGLLESVTVIDSEIPGTEPKLVPSFSEEEKELIKTLIMDKITRF